jgi:glycosyltransferase involved in cell wall biosynthesis
MAMAKPILASRVGDIPEILGNTGYLVNPNSPGELAAQIRAIFDNYATALKLGERARERCKENYSIEQMSQTLKSLLSEYLSEN